METRGQDFIQNSFFEVFVTADEMRADIVFHKPKEGVKAMSFSDVSRIIKEEGLVYGVREDVINKILILKLYERRVSFAFGQNPEEGQDGYFEYFFKREFDRKPAIMEDGNADYMHFETYARVKKEDVLVKYHPAVLGVKGSTVFGKELDVLPRIDLPPLKGKGFRTLPDGETYIADINGKVELKDGELLVTKIHEVFGDVSSKSGNIDFDGDVIIHGKVRNGMMVEATGTVTVEDIVEAATIRAGCDVIMRAGAMGNGTGAIQAEGDVFGKFYEKMEVYSKQSIFCDYAMNSNLYASKSVVLTGTKGSVIGGVTYGKESVECINLGNVNNVLTLVQCGVSKDTLFDYYEAKQAIPMVKATIDELERKRKNQKGPDLTEEEYRSAQEKLSVFKEKVESVEKELEQAKDSFVLVKGIAYTGAVLEISAERYAIAENKSKTRFTTDKGYICETKQQ